MLIACLAVDSHDQLRLILDVLGTPPMEEFYDVTSRRSRDYLRNLPVRTKKSFESLYPKASPAAIDFLKRTLTCKQTPGLAEWMTVVLIFAFVTCSQPEEAHDR